jgi:hypothetical protein
MSIIIKSLRILKATVAARTAETIQQTICDILIVKFVKQRKLMYLDSCLIMTQCTVSLDCCLITSQCTV